MRRLGAVGRGVGRCCSHCVHTLERLLIAGVLLVTAACLYLHLIGFPQAVTRNVLNRLHERGYCVTLDRVRLDWLRGLAADRLRLYAAERDRVPLLEAEHVFVLFNPLRWLRYRTAPFRLQVAEGTLRLNMTGWGPTRLGGSQVVADHVCMDVAVDEQAVWVRDAEASMLGMRWQGEGTVFRPPPVGTRRVPRNLMEEFQVLLARRPDWVPELVRQFNSVRYEHPPEARVSFTLYTAPSQANRVSLEVTGGPTQVRDVRFDDVQLRAEWRDGEIRVPICAFSRMDQVVSVNGSYAPVSRLVTGRLFSNLAPAEWLRLLPAAWTNRVREEGWNCEGGLTCEVNWEQVPIAEALEHFSGWAALGGCTWRNVWLQKGLVSFERQRNTLRLVKVDAVLGRDRRQGRLSGAGSFDLATKSYAGRARTSFDPTLLLPLLNTNQVAIMRRFAFSGPMPQTELQFRGRIGDIHALVLSGNGQAEACSYHGVPVDHAFATVSVSNCVMVLDPLEVRRPEGFFNGWLALDFDAETVTVNGTNTLAAQDTARMIGPAAARFASRFRTEGPLRVAGAGRVDYGDNSATEIEADVRGRLAGMEWFLADELAFHVRVCGPTVTVTRIEGDVYDGRLTGQALFFPIIVSTNVRYAFQGGVSNADFSRLASSWRGTNEVFYKGRVSLSGSMSGVIGAGQGGSVRGQCYLRIEEGQLFQIPLLGPISRVLALLHPRFGYSMQTDFTATGILRDGRIYTRNAELAGTFLTMTGVGSYAFDRELDFTVRAQLLRDGSVASVFRFVTFPFTKLLEFKLGGTLNRPKWRPVNLPKELFFIFD